MVLLGGLEIVAAGYILNEMHKDDKTNQRSSSTQPPHRRRKHRDSSSSRPHQPRPSQQDLLLPPQPQGPPRPNSAPPQQFGPPRMNTAPMQQQGLPPPGQHLGPLWMNPNQPFSQPHQAQTWHYPPPRQEAYHQPAPQQRPAAPPNSAYAGTVNNAVPMYFDTKTGKWQSGMLPPEMPRSDSAPVARDLGEGKTKRRERRRRHRSSSSGSEASRSSTDSDLAYGHISGQRQHWHTREPAPPYQEHDWYGNQNYAPGEPALHRENRAATVSGAGLNGTSAPRPGFVELDAETPGRYRPHGKY